MKKTTGLGLMSGTSLDGLDMVLCSFLQEKSRWMYEIISTKTVSYPDLFSRQLAEAHKYSGLMLAKLDREYGRWLGKKATQFIKEHDILPSFIASHGHTVFHQPENRITLQIGSGAEILSATGITTITDFRSVDMALGGQGAPLVPVGDYLLFSDYEFCLNLGGIANISCVNDNKRLAWDICPANMALNLIAGKMNMKMDRDGIEGKKGSVNKQLLKELNGLEFYETIPPKSLGREWFEGRFLKILLNHPTSWYDKLRTVYEHISLMVASACSSNPKGRLLVTGGGAHNIFLIERIKHHSKHDIIIPGKNIIDFKEALIFAFLGLLRLENKVNCLSSVTGSSRDNIGGSVYQPA
ncbi:MAG: anhydro-N-acetylmuramic acid kinase [Bacteroidetes bacterium]|nr:anhydro-N-acetylmuramic acid kinase [Bacteroidota bacterium]